MKKSVGPKMNFAGRLPLSGRDTKSPYTSDWGEERSIQLLGPIGNFIYIPHRARVNWEVALADKLQDCAL